MSNIHYRNSFDQSEHEVKKNLYIDNQRFVCRFGLESNQITGSFFMILNEYKGF